jgi:hypothetical protein
LMADGLQDNLKEYDKRRFNFNCLKRLLCIVFRS